MIPKVKMWQVTLVDGTRVLVPAPTKFLARLNYNYDEAHKFNSPVLKIGYSRPYDR